MTRKCGSSGIGIGVGVGVGVGVLGVVDEGMAESTLELEVDRGRVCVLAMILRAIGDSIGSTLR